MADERLVSPKSVMEWEDWLQKNHARSNGVWLQLYKKGAGIEGVSYAEALDSALCHGWIDSQKKSHDQESWLQRFSPRKPKGVWSKINTAHVERLLKLGRLKEAGLAAVEAAKLDGRWHAAYDPPSRAAVPEDFLTQLHKSKPATEFFSTLNKANLYAIVWRLQTAKKPETRERRIRVIVEMLAMGEKFHG